MNKIEHTWDLISYLYGEMSEEEKALFEEELKQNPSLQEELVAFKATRSCLQVANEVQEAPALPVLPLDRPRESKTSHPQWWQSPWLQAAVFAMTLMCSAALTGLQMKWNTEEGFSLRFGAADRPVEVVESAQSSNEVHSLSTLAEENTLIRQLLLAQQDSLSQQVETLYGKLDTQLRQRIARLANHKQEVSLSEDQFSSIRKELLRENYQLMTDLMEYGAEYQRSYNEQMLGEFAQYLDRQRSNDLQLISVALQDILQQNNIQQQETEILLGQLINHIASD